jgi:hypothetical protein
MLAQGVPYDLFFTIGHPLPLALDVPNIGGTLWEGQLTGGPCISLSVLQIRRQSSASA